MSDVLQNYALFWLIGPHTHAQILDNILASMTSAVDL